MQQIIGTLSLPEGKFNSKVMIFGESDKEKLKVIYTSWRNLCDLLVEMGARKINLPEGLSEPAFCMAKGMARITQSISGANTSFDCYDPKGERGNNRIQVKACSVIPDLTSFGPNSEWDRIFFVDFYREGNWDGSFDVYEISTEDVYNMRVNETETMADQKKLGRRPRFSIYANLIEKGMYISKETFNLFE
ncbi:Bsp6I family type II restriction endonuclease [Clostridium sp. DSM 17811]|uniref:Bsp6I family type II restriction endonuclease n=1 Tax=Clostridium sp. DSM 17811 TaxID=2843317 RepID=UPI001C0DDEE7|nr:Bsp6I family type II restriction endonuclease [Clostridium sp. DSM 17811]MBU3102261.1 Bsp6I family type II restriction endonuclease [Clostridium sp. DSM 17811]